MNLSKKINTFFALMLFILITSFILFFKSYNHKNFIAVGDLKQNRCWIYLCGLTSDINADQEKTNRKILNEIGKELNLKFLAIKPTYRDKNFDNKLSWPHYNKTETLATYKKILSSIGNLKIVGWIGFSNGGFFLNNLAQIKELNAPIISIGSAGCFYNANKKNYIHFLIGVDDKYHYKHTLNLFNQIISQKSKLSASLSVFSSGHEINKPSLKKCLQTIIST